MKMQKLKGVCEDKHLALLFACFDNHLSAVLWFWLCFGLFLGIRAAREIVALEKKLEINVKV